MKTKVELEFISKVLELSEKMRNLAIFWQSNLEMLKDINECKFSESLDDLTVSPEDTNVCKNYPTCEFLQDLAFDTFNWFLTLNNAYFEKMQK